MATATPLKEEKNEDNFELELSRVRERIGSVFDELVECLESQKRDLFKQLDNNLTRYLSYKHQTEELRERKVELERLRLLQHQEQFSTRVKDLQDSILKLINTELETIVMPVKPKLVTFVCDRNALLVAVSKLCKLVETVSEIDYKSKTQSMISVCDRGTGDEQLNCPLGVTVDHNTGHIYVADQYNKCVKVFDNTAKYVFKFGDSGGEGKMDCPTGLVICCDKVLITQNSNILIYQLNGKFVTRIGNEGSGNLQFNFPFGLATDESNNDIYICDSSNNRVQIISQNFQYKSQFGKDILHYPIDIKLYRDSIFIIDRSNPCLHVFNRDLVLQKSVVTRGEGQQVVYPRFFYIDKFGSILISDCDSNSILILSSEFEFIHKISTSEYPMGITMDEEDKVIVVCQSANNCLQIF